MKSATGHIPEAQGAPAFRRVPHALAIFAAIFTLPLLFVGGSVTTYRVGLAVPDWPTTFGINMFLYDFWNAPFGVRVEHSHRLYGAAVGLATIGLWICLLIFDTRTWMKWLGTFALVAVVTQGVLGGTRVTEISTLLAAIHGCTGQAFFALVVALAVLTGRDWIGSEEPLPDQLGLRRGSLLLLTLAWLQIMLGAWLRHGGTLPGLVSHGLVAVAVLLVALGIAWRVLRGPADAVPPSLRWPARFLVLAVLSQVALGIASLVYLLPFGGVPAPVGLYEAIARTGHQTNAALLLATAVTLALRAWRHLSPVSLLEAEGLIIDPTDSGRPSPGTLEVVA